MTARREQQASEELLALPEDQHMLFSADGFKRAEYRFNDSCSYLVDIHSAHNSRIYYLRVAAERVFDEISISSLVTIVDVRESGDFGVLLRARQEENCYTIWIPSAFGQFHFDDHDRIATSRKPSLSHQWSFHPHFRLRILPHDRIHEIAVIPYVVMLDPEGKYFEELSSLHDVEQRLYRKSDWFFANRPSDVWNYLVNGSIYDPRTRRGVDKRFKCQQCAYAWWSYFGLLYKETGKKAHNLMRDAVAFSTLLDMSAEGEWRHGYWSDEIETHARFHLDGLHLLLSQYSKTGDMIWLQAADRGMTSVFRHLTEQLDDGSLWFLHDTIEKSHRHHFKSTLFGKSPGNSLCINTHLQALVVLHRLHLALPSNEIYAESFDRGVKALRRVLDYQPGDIVYKRLMPWITGYMGRRVLPARRKNSLWRKLRNGLERRIIGRVYWPVCRRFPRIVQPGGFIKRDLTLTFASYPYQIINLKDLLTLYKQKPFAWLRSYIKDGITFVRAFVDEVEIENVVESSPFYIELIDVCHLYDRLIERIPPKEIKDVERKIYHQSRGYSLDYYASELVRCSPHNN